MARITIIDDDVEFAEDIAKVLEKHGHEVARLHEVQGATQALCDNPPDLLILDVMFPNNPVAGFDTARQIRRTRPIRKLPIILLTGVNQDFPMDFSAKDIDAEWMPVQDFLEKPADSALLLNKIRDMLALPD